MRWPDFLIIGAAKSGTTSLCQYLKQHPDVFVSRPKEPNYFACVGETYTGQATDAAARAYYDRVMTKALTDPSAYTDLFAEAGTRKAGEASVTNLYSPNAAARIHAQLPTARIIAIIRNPVDRAFSHYLFRRRQGHVSGEFETLIADEPVDSVNFWDGDRHWLRQGFFYQQLARYYEQFPADQIQVFLMDDLKQDADAVMRTLFAHIGVDPAFPVETGRRYSVSGVPKNERVNAAVFDRGSRARQLVRPLFQKLPARTQQGIIDRYLRRNIVKPMLAHETRQQLLQLYRDDIGRLAELIDRDLSHWFDL